MRARLVAYSKATPEFEAEGLTDLQELIAFCAKVSNPSAQINTATSERLIKYLIKQINKQRKHVYTHMSRCRSIDL